MSESDNNKKRNRFWDFQNKIGIIGCLSEGFIILFLLGIVLDLIFGKTVGILSGGMVGLSVTSLFVFGIIAACRRIGIFSFCKALALKEIIAAAAITLCLIIFYCVYISLEDFVYFWDYGAFWNSTLDFTDTMYSSPVIAVGMTVGTINALEYNTLISIITAFPLSLLGGSYFAYYLLVLVLFYIPSSFIFAVTVYSAVKNKCGGAMPFWIFYAGTLLVGVGLVPILNGFVDAFCLLTAAIALGLMFKHRFLVRNTGDSVTLALMLIITVIGRRYFLYLLVGFTAAVLVSGAVFFIVTGSRKQPVKESLKNFVANMLTVAGVCLLLLCTICIGFTVLSLFGNYADAYQGYQHGGLIENFGEVFLYYGWIVWAFVLGGLIFAAVKRIFFEPGFMLVWFFVAAVMFFTVQSMAQQHYYVIIFPVTYFVLLGMNAVYSLFAAKDERIMKQAGSYVITAVMLFNFLCSTVLGSTAVGSAVSSCYAVPRVRTDKPALISLTDELYSLVEGTNYKIYAIGSGDTFNGDVLNKLYKPEQTKISANMAAVSHVDLRDGFPVGFWQAEVIVTATPCEYHLGEQHQRVVSIPYNAIAGVSPLNDNYDKLGSYSLDNGIVATVWKKTAPLDLADRDYLSDEFNKYYADYPALFADKIKNCLNG